MNIVDLLLSANAKEILAKNTKKLELKRLSKMLGEPFIITIQEIESEKLTHLQMSAVKINKNIDISDVDVHKLQMLILAAGIVEPDFNDKDLLKKYGCATKADLFGKLFKGWEIAYIVKEISSLGVGEGLIEQVKN